MIPLSDTEMLTLRQCSQDDAAYQQLLELVTTVQQREVQYTQAVVEQYTKLQASLMNAQTMMMTRIAHEFRTPLAIILTSGDLLERYFDRLDTDKRYHHLHKIRAQVHRVAGLLDDIMAMLQAMLHQHHPHNMPLALDELCQEVLKRIQMTSGIHHHCHFTISGTPRLVNADENLLHALLMALLSNALKYSPEQSVVQFDLQFAAPDEGLRVRVQNSGVGIAAADMPHLFEAFFRGDNTSATSGLGLGLYIVQQIVTLYAGTVTVDNQPEGTTTFNVWLPL